MNNFLSRNELKSILGGNTHDLEFAGESCTIYCGNGEEGTSLPDCSRDAATKACGGDPAGSTCSCA